MDTPEQVISKIRSAPDDAAAMKVLDECGYKLAPSEKESESEGPEIEVQFGGGMSPRQKFMNDRLGGARGA